MKILVISHEYPPIGGGGANACRYLTDEMANEGHDITIVTADYKGMGYEKKNMGDIGSVAVVRVQCLRKSREKSTFMEMLTFLVSAWKYTDKLLRTEHYDMCLVFFGIPSGPLAMHLRRKYGLHYVVRLGGGDIPGAQKRFRLIYELLDKTIRRIWREADAIVANSKGLKGRALGFESRYDISIISNGVDTKYYCPTSVSKFENNEVILLCVSRLIEGKGLQYILPGIRNLSGQIKDYNGKNVRLVIVGDGPYRDKLENIVSELKIRDIVTFTGTLDKEQVRDRYNASDIFILPSLSEGMPNVVLEAMSCGLPIIMTPCEGSEELISDNGIISSIEDFADNIIKLCLDENLRTTMGNRGRMRALAEFRWKNIAEDYINILQKK